MNSIMHIGAGKCGSSSLQTILSQKPCFNNKDHSKKFNYICINKYSDISTGNQLSQQAQKGTLGYCASASIRELISNGKIGNLRNKIQSLLNTGITPILSSETWINESDIFKENETLIKLGLNVRVLVFVRPQVPWINSAWWQWGAWSGQQFDSWIETTAKNSAQWTKLIQSWQEVPGVEEVQVHTLSKDVITTFFEALEVSAPVIEKSNKSLGADVVRFFQRNRQFRPHEHASEIDFILERNLPASNNGTPWVIPKEKTAELIEYYRDNNQKLLSFVSDEEKKAIEQDPKWWDASAYDHLEVSSPDPIDPTVEDIEELTRRAIEAVVELDRKLRRETAHTNNSNKKLLSEGNLTPMTLRKAISLNGIRRFLGMQPVKLK